MFWYSDCFYTHKAYAVAIRGGQACFGRCISSVIRVFTALFHSWKFLCFAQLKISPSVYLLDCMRLIYGQSFHKPPEFLSGKWPNLGILSWPLVFPLIQSLIVKNKAIFFKVERLNTIASTATEKIKWIWKWIKVISVLDYAHQSIYALA